MTVRGGWIQGGGQELENPPTVTVTIFLGKEKPKTLGFLPTEKLVIHITLK
jgi:hypothetical protein